jgi:hypothetical protein
MSLRLPKDYIFRFLGFLVGNRWEAVDAAACVVFGSLFSYIAVQSMRWRVVAARIA